jgi:hypothetical protein
MSLKTLVGAAGIEPATPTMSTFVPYPVPHSRATLLPPFQSRLFAFWPRVSVAYPWRALFPALLCLRLAGCGRAG